MQHPDPKTEYLRLTLFICLLCAIMPMRQLFYHPLLLSSFVMMLMQHVKNQEIERIMLILSKVSIAGIFLMTIGVIISSEITIFASNYVSVLDHFCFILGISIFFVAVLIASLLLLPNTGAIIFILACLSFALSYTKLMNEIVYPMDLRGFYEMLFTSISAVLSFLYIYIAHYLLHSVIASEARQSTPLVRFSWIAASLPLLVMTSAFLLAGHFMYTIDSAEFIIYYTEYVQYLRRILGVAAIAHITFKLFRSSSNMKIPVVLAMILLAMSDFTYQGVILPVMCYIYFLLKPKDNLLLFAKIQVIIYFLAEVVHVRYVCEVSMIMFVVIAMKEMRSNRGKSASI